MGTSTLSLIRFLLARLDDADAQLSRRARHLRDVHDKAVLAQETLAIAHEREDILATRRVIGSAQHLLVLRDLPTERAVRDIATRILVSLAAPYSDHPGYRHDWAALAPDVALAEPA